MNDFYWSSSPSLVLDEYLFIGSAITTIVVIKSFISLFEKPLENKPTIQVIKNLISNYSNKYLVEKKNYILSSLKINRQHVKKSKKQKF